MSYNELIKIDLNEKGTEELIPIYKTTEGNKFIDGRELWSKIGKPQGNFADFIKRKVVSKGFKENVDYVKKNVFIRGNSFGHGNKSLKEYQLTLECAITILRREDLTPNAINILNYLLHKNKKSLELVIRKQTRKEHQFQTMLEEITGLEWDKQYPIDKYKYRLDFYLKNILIVEYDENYHNYQIYNDKKRMEYCIDWLAKNETNGYKIPYIRVKEEYELEGIHRIMMFLIKNNTYLTLHKNN